MFTRLFIITKPMQTLQLETFSDGMFSFMRQNAVYMVDGNIKGKYNLDKYENASQMRERERSLNNWLMEMGW